MTRFVAGCLGLALVAIAGLAAYTAAHPLHCGVSEVAVAAISDGRVSRISTRAPSTLRAPSALRVRVCASPQKLLG